jgi:hypothetical protein
MRQETFKLTSGLQVELRQLKLAEENILANARKSKRSQMNKVLSQVLSKCTVSTVDSGPYNFTGDVPWDKVLSGDKVDAMLSLRKISYKDGDKLFVPDVFCPSCRSRFAWEVDLEEDLSYQKLPEESFEKLKNGTPFEVDISGHKVLFELTSGEQEARYEKLKKQNPNREMSAGLRSRIIDVVPPSGDKLARKDIMNWLDGNSGDFDGLTSDDGEELRDAMDSVDAGVDLEVEALCSDCGGPVTFDLPFSYVFLPGKGIKKRKVQRRG